MYGRIDNRGGFPNKDKQLREFFFGGGIPATMTLIVVSLVSFFVISLAGRGAIGLVQALAFRSDLFPMQFWTLLTWPLVNTSLWTILTVLSLWMFGGSLERSWGTRTYLLLLGAATIFLALSLWVGGLILREPVALAGMYFATAPVVIAWCSVNQREQVGLYFVMVPAPILAAIAAVFLWGYIGGAWLGLFALPVCIAAWLYPKYGRYGTRGYTENPFVRRRESRRETPPRFRNFDEGVSVPPFWQNPMAWWKDRQERKRLERIFRNSGYTDKD